MGYIYDVQSRHGVVRILMTMPHRGRPVYQFFASQGGGRVSEGIRQRLLKLPGVRDVVVDFTWEPEWSTAAANRCRPRRARPSNEIERRARRTYADSFHNCAAFRPRIFR